MRRELPDYFADLGDVLTELRTFDEEFFFNIEKLVEVIQLEIEFIILPQLPRETNETYSWSDGLNYIFISVHAEGENPVHCEIKVGPLSN